MHDMSRQRYEHAVTVKALACCIGIKGSVKLMTMSRMQFNLSVRPLKLATISRKRGNHSRLNQFPCSFYLHVAWNAISLKPLSFSRKSWDHLHEISFESAPIFREGASFQILHVVAVWKIQPCFLASDAVLVVIKADLDGTNSCLRLSHASFVVRAADVMLNRVTLVARFKTCQNQTIFSFCVHTSIVRKLQLWFTRYNSCLRFNLTIHVMRQNCHRLSRPKFYLVENFPCSE